MAKIYQRHGSPFWWGRITHKGTEHRKSLETEIKRVAEERLAAWISELKGTNWGEKPRQKFDDAAIKFAQEHLPTLKPSSRKRYHVSLNNLTEHFEGRFLDEITSGPLSDFEHARRSAGVSNGTIRRDLSCLSSLLTKAIDWEWIDVNASAVFIKKRAKRGLKEAPPLTRYLNHEEEQRLLAACGDDEMLRCAIEFAIDTGLRREEQFGTLWKNVDLPNQEISVPNEKSKSGIGRTVPLLPRAVMALAKLKQHPRCQYVFWREDGFRYSPKSGYFWRALQRTAGKAGIENLRWHDLRRTCGCRLLQDHDMPLAGVRDWLGHGSISVTEKAYAFLSVEKLHGFVGTGGKPLRLAKTPASIKAKALEGHGVVYLIEGAGFIKIGISREPDVRLKSLQAGSPVPLKFINSRKVRLGHLLLIEAQVHAALSKFRHHGEWFAISASEAVLVLDQVLTTHKTWHSEADNNAQANGDSIENNVVFLAKPTAQ